MAVFVVESLHLSSSVGPILGFDLCLENRDDLRMNTSLFKIRVLGYGKVRLVQRLLGGGFHLFDSVALFQLKFLRSNF